MSKFLSFLISLFFILNVAYAQNQWTYVSSVTGLQPINSIAVVNENVIWVACDASGLYLTTNAGLNWTLRNTGLPSTNLYGIAAIDANNCWVGTQTGSIYYTSNGGTSWTSQIAISGSFINGIHFFNTNTGVFIGDPTGASQPYQNRYTTNGGTNWILAPNSPVATTSSEWGVINAWDWTDQSHFWLGSANQIASSTTAKIFRTSTGFPGTWLTATITGVGGAQGLYYQAIAFTDNNNGMTGSNGSYVKKTTDGGATWSIVSHPPGTAVPYYINMYGFKDASNLIRVSLQDTTYKVYRTTNYGSSWTQETLPPQGLSGLQHMQFINQNLGYAGGDLGAFLRYGPPTGVGGNGNNTPSVFALKQNYPNPFNPETTIEYSVPSNAFVTIKVFDVMGREIAELVNGKKSTGNYIVQFDAKDLNSGIYFYTLETNGFKETKKMLLIK